MSEDMSEEMSEDMSIEMSGDMSKEMSKDMSTEMSNNTGRIRFTYPALKVVLKPISWNHQKTFLSLKPRPPYGLVGPNHLIPSNLGPFSHKHSISHPTRRKAQNAQDGHPYHQD